jgi:hypothetical protein
MAKLGIFTGTSPNDTTGDTLSQGAVKINSNFSEIYNAIGDGTNITNSLSSIKVAGLSTFTNGPVLVGSGIQTGTSKLQVSGNTFITGSVGIGTTNPTTLLHVIGDGRFTGVVTALSFSGNSSSASYATTAGIATYATNAGTSTSVVGGIGSITQLRVTGISTFTNGPVLIGGGTSTGTVGQVLQVTGISSDVYIGGFVGIGTTVPLKRLHIVGDVKVDGTITGEISNTVATAKTSTNVIGGIGSITQLQVGPGITTVSFITASNLYVSGITTVGFITATNAYIGVATVGFITATNAYIGVATVGFITATNAYISGVTTFIGNSYFSNSIGIGTTNPSSSLSVNGSTVIGTQILDMTGLSSTFTTVGSNTFVVPAGITKISAVLIGGGGAGGASDGSSGGNGGGGGGLTYINDFPVNSGQTLTIFVGSGGVAVSGGVGGDGGNSSITGIATAFGGKGGAGSYTGLVGVGGTGSNIFGNIGAGGSGGRATLTYGAGGGGTSGYVGGGGNGGGDGADAGAAGSGGGASGGSSGSSGSSGGSGGGGTGILGQGSSGASATNIGGNAGSGGSNGSTGNTSNGAAGGLYGGGGGGGDGGSGTVIGGNGAQGVVRIIWSPSSKFSRSFPTSQVGNNINQ